MTKNNPIRIFDSSLNLITELDDYASAYFTRSWSGAGDFSIQTNYNTVHAPELQRGRIVMFDKNVKKCGIITNVKKAIGESGKGSMIVTATGIELKGILGWRIVPPSSGSEYYTLSDSAETVMKTLVSQNGGPTTADADRKFPLLEIDTDADLGSTYLLKTRYNSTVLAECSACSLATNTGFYIYLDLSAKKFRFQTAQGLDRSGSQSVNPRAIFSTDYDTLKSANIDDNDSNYRNLAYVGGQGEGVQRIIREVFTGTAEPTGMARREMFVDARDVPLAADLDIRGGQKLEELATIITVDGSPLAYSPLVYGTDYDLGDIATLSAYDESRNVRITSVKESWESLNYSIDLTFDRLPQTLQTQVSGAVASIKNSLNSVGGTVIESTATTMKFGDGTTIQKSLDTTSNPSFNKLSLTSVDDLSLSNLSGALRIGDPAGMHMAFDGNEIMAKASPSTIGTLYLQNEGGGVVVWGAATRGLGVTNASSNSNGYFICLDDGTLIMRRFISAPTINANVAAAFPYTPYGLSGFDGGSVSMSYVPSGSNNVFYQVWIQGGSWMYYLQGYVQPIYLTFIGRWKA